MRYVQVKDKELLSSLTIHNMVFAFASESHGNKVENPERHCT